MRNKYASIAKIFPYLDKENYVSRSILIVVALIIAILLPNLMVFSTRSSAALLVIAALLLCLVEYGEMRKAGGSKITPRSHRIGLADFPFFPLWIGFAALALLSIIYTQNPIFHTRRLVEFMLPVLAGGVLFSIVRHRLLPITTPLLAVGLTIAAILALLELMFGAPIRQEMGLKPENFRLNRSVVTLVLLFFPLFALAVSEKRLWLALVAVPLPLFAIYNSESGAAVFGAIIGILACGLAKMSIPVTAWIFRLSTLAIWLLAPWHGTILTQIIPPSVHEKMISTSSAIRVEIYRAFGKVAEGSPWLGAGFNTTATPQDEPVYSQIPPALQAYIGYGHPHNAALQLWVELGVIGVVFAIALTWGALRLISQVPRDIQPLWYGFFAACFAISMVSHGAWQAWWAANIAICLGLMMMALHIPHKDAANE